tara:strand:+ start:13200 stop:13496 length:297 start_codon:yes stop_codon:yes gene_type:complete
MAEYKFNSSYFKKGESDTVVFPNGGSVKIYKGSVLSRKNLAFLNGLGKEYVTLEKADCGTSKCETPKKVKTTKKVKIDEPRKEEELQEEVSTETSEEE